MQSYRDEELRKHRRYRVKAGVFAVLGNEFSKLGQIIDVSMGGLSFSYAGTTDKKVDTTDMIFLFDKKDANVNNLSYKFRTTIVSEQTINRGRHSAGNNQRVRCALKFTDLLYHQKKWLETFLRNHTIRESV